MKRYAYAILLPLSFLLFAFSCDQWTTTDSNKVLSGKQEGLMQEANRQAGMPSIVNFQERKLFKHILELRDQEGLIMFAYLVPELTGKPVFLGKCVGYGIPYSTQYTNPEKEVYPGGYNYGFGSLPQADPNGLFMPSSADGTWLMLVDPDTGNPEAVYIEPKVLVSPFKLKNAVY